MFLLLTINWFGITIIIHLSATECLENIHHYSLALEQGIIVEYCTTLMSFTCGGIFNRNSFELLMEDKREMDMSGNSSHGVLS